MTGMDDLVTWLRGEINTDEAGLRTWLSNLPDDSGAADWVRQFLVEVDAKRRIIDFLDPSDAPEGDGKFVAERALLLLALPYADRPGYRDGQRP
jgi:hypothetical protein